MTTFSSGKSTTNSLVYTTDQSGNLVFQTNGSTTALTLEDNQDATFTGNVIVTGNSSTLVIPSGAVDVRPATPTLGATRINTTANTIESYTSNGTSTNWSTTYGGPLFSVYNTTAQTLPLNTNTKINLQNKVYDTHNCFNNTANTATLNGLSVPAYSFMPFVPGWYQFNFAVRKASSTAEIVAAITKNNTTVGQGSDTLSNVLSSSGTNMFFLNGTTDFVNLVAYNGTTATATESRTNTVNGVTHGLDTYLQGFMVRGI